MKNNSVKVTVQVSLFTNFILNNHYVFKIFRKHYYDVIDKNSYFKINNMFLISILLRIADGEKVLDKGIWKQQQ